MAKTEIENMGYCIICRRNNVSLSDEHVIPDSIGGYYHIHTVCKECNSKLGDNVDVKLLNHTLIKLHRFSKRMRGKTGYIPNPFDVKSTTDTGQAVRVEDKNGVLTPFLLPDIKSNADGSHIQITLDRRAEEDIEKIIAKKLKKQGITSKTHQFVETRTYHEFKPTITSTLSFDLEEFKLGILKIAYEFAVDSLPDFINDKNAIIISEILLNQDISRLSTIQFIGDGFENIIQPVFGNLIDFSNKDRHYLFLIETEEKLVCFVNLFNIISIGLVLSEKQKFLKDDFIVGINDINAAVFNKFTSIEIFNKTRHSLEYQFQYSFSSLEEAHTFSMLIKNCCFKHFTLGNKTPLFFRNGSIAYEDFSLKLIEIQDVNDLYDNGTFVVEYKMDEELYVKCLQNDILALIPQHN